MASKIIYPELSYQVVGILFTVCNRLGPIHREQTFQKAIATLLERQDIPFGEQVTVPIIID